MDKNKPLREDIMGAWERYWNKTNTCEDLALILDLIRMDQLQEFDEVFDRQWDMAINGLPPTPEERKEIYRQKAAQILAEYESRQAALTKQTPTRISIRRFRKMWYAAAAVLLLGLLIPSGYYYLRPKTGFTSAQTIETFTRHGEIRIVVLPDHTEVTLNAGSRIKYPTNFTGDERLVELYGEALFDVTSDPSRPFIVQTENMKIKVTGTVFDVREYDEDGVVSVAVASGRVEVSLAEEKIILAQSQQLKMEKATRNLEKMTFDVDKFMSWTDGTLYFYRTPIREVVNILNRHYPQVDIELAEGEYTYLISGKHKNVSPEEILNSIVYTTGLKCKKKGNKYTLYN